MKDSVLVELKNSIAEIKINRPKKRNAINNDVINSLQKHTKKIDNNDNIKVIIITGAGDKAFSAGADINELANEDPKERKEKNEASFIVYNIKKPVIAMINGYALGGGFELALSCDLRISSNNAKLGFPEITRGWMPGGGGTQLLPRIVGQSKAMEIIMSGEMIDAKEAESLGIINKVVPEKNLERKTIELASRIEKYDMTALKLIKEAVRMSSNIDIKSGFSLEKNFLEICFYSKAKEKGINEFLDKITK